MLFCYICIATMGAENSGKNKGKGQGHQGKPGGPSATAVDVRFGPDEVNVIRQYYRAHSASLPPGLQKKLARGKPLPPGWQKKLQPFPLEIENRLDPPCGHCGRGVIDSYGVIYDKKTAIILDIVQLAGDILR